jgi:glucosyl-3-phosphoglycerate synthase
VTLQTITSLPSAAARAARSSAGAALAPPGRALRAVVVVPARDEVERIGRCLLALARQRRVPLAHFEVIVVLDGCADATADRVLEVAAEVPRLALHSIELTAAQGVGRARSVGMDIACERLLSLGQPHGLIASTDADTVVDEGWLAVQLELVARGARAIGGLVELDPDEACALPAAVLDDRARRAARRMEVVLAHEDLPEPPVTEHHHFSGASLAVTAQTYRECGGLPVCAALEDEAFERELRQRRIAIHRSDAVRVKTSARTEGRAPRGLARDLSLSSWRARRTYRADQFPLERLLAAKDASIALVLPAREVAATIGSIAADAVSLKHAGLLDEVLVVDAASRDGTAEVAERAGVTVVQENDLSSELGPALGKGDAMWRALRTIESDIVVFADADSEDFGEHFVRGLVGPLICEPGIWLVKGSFQRPFRAGATVLEAEGGRVTELLARPLLNLHAPQLAVFDQPLAGELAARRTLLDEIPFSAGYGVEIAMLIDAWRIVGVDGLAQVDLGTRQNRHQSLRELSAMAYAVMVAAESRFLGTDFADAHVCASIAVPPIGGVGPMDMRPVTIDERPPLGQRPANAPSAIAACLAAHAVPAGNSSHRTG